jgi:hypothetical protein
VVSGAAALLPVRRRYGGDLPALALQGEQVYIGGASCTFPADKAHRWHGGGWSLPHLFLASHHRTTSQPTVKHAIVPVVPMAHAASIGIIMSNTINLNSYEVLAIGNSSPGPTLGERARSNRDHLRSQKRPLRWKWDQFHPSGRNTFRGPGRNTFRGNLERKAGDGAVSAGPRRDAATTSARPARFTEQVRCAEYFALRLARSTFNA